MENRLIDLPAGLLLSLLTQAANYLNSRLTGKTLDEARLVIQKKLMSIGQN